MNPRKHLAGKLGELQQRLGATQGKQYWRTLEELAESAAFQELLRVEFPEQAAAATTTLSRRQFLTLMGASLALAGVSGCSVRPAPSREIVPYVRAPEEIVPGKPLFFATTMTLGGASVGLLVESHLGRPTKVEGNPEHPGSGNPRDPLGQGATDIYSQASVLTLYDPDRSQSVTQLGEIRTWDEALSMLRDAIAKQKARRGGGLRLLSESIVSPTLGSQIEAFLKAFPDARWHQYEPLAPDTAYRGAMMAFGQPVNICYDFRKADRVLSFDADFLACGPGNVRYVADFMSRRRVRTTVEEARQAEMNRLYVVETALTNTGAKADHRLALPPSQIEGVARAVAAHMGVIERGQGEGLHAEWAAAVARDLQLPEYRGRSIVLAGDRQPPAVHLLAHAMNDRLGNVGQTLRYTDPVPARPMDQTQSLRELTDAMEQGQVEVLIVLGGNPVFTAPADFRFAERMQKVPLRIHLSLFQDETSRQCHWHLPEAHYLEAWSDGRAYDGTASIAQPLIAPLYGGRSAHELLSILTDQLQRPGYEIVRDYWRRHWRRQGSTGADFEQFWQTAVHDGVVPDTEFSSKNVRLAGDWQRHLPQSAPQAVSKGYELVFQSDPTIYDGRFANNGWLQELPKPLTKITWDNAALMSPATAAKLEVKLGAYAHGGEHGGFEQDIVELRLGDRSVRLPAWIMPGHADDSITVYLGYGRDYAGKVGGMDGRKVGCDVYPLRTSEHPGFVSDVAIRKTGERYALACTQQHQLMENRQTVRADTLAKYHSKPTFAAEKDEEEEHEHTHRARTPLSMYEQYKYPGHKWGMAIDLTTCVGCNACVVACQAENNIPVVGKEQVLAGREMHWLRIDRYLSGPFDDPREFYFQPVPCMHCENAPCEYVCPVEATVHSADGLNDMIYQRCVGTRFCSNNCPYKVRRFNFFFYADYTNPTLRQQYNPDVTVRSRGVMEKCSYCVQRIRHAEVNAQKEGRSIVDGEVLTACQATCPAGAIVFGDINDEHATVRSWKDSPLNYGLLTDLNTNPRTTYLAALRNPNTELEAEHDGQ